MGRGAHNHWDHQGFLFALVLGEEFLTLKLLRLLPLARVRLSDIVYIRQRSGRDLAAMAGDAILRPFRNWYWPHPLFMGRGDFDHAPYVIRTRGGVSVFVRLRHSFHWKLRDAVGNARAGSDEAVADM